MRGIYTSCNRWRSAVVWTVTGRSCGWCRDCRGFQVNEMLAKSLCPREQFRKHSHFQQNYPWLERILPVFRACLLFVLKFQVCHITSPGHQVSTCRVHQGSRACGSHRRCSSDQWTPSLSSPLPLSYFLQKILKNSPIPLSRHLIFFNLGLNSCKGGKSLHNVNIFLWFDDSLIHESNRYFLIFQLQGIF